MLRITQQPQHLKQAITLKDILSIKKRWRRTHRYAINAININTYHKSITSCDTMVLMILYLHYFCSSTLFVTSIGNCYHCLGQIDERLACYRVHIKRSGGALIAVLANALHKRYLCQQGHIHLLCKIFASLFTKDVVFVFGQFGRRFRYILHQIFCGFLR